MIISTDEINVWVWGFFFLILTRRWIFGLEQKCVFKWVHIPKAAAPLQVGPALLPPPLSSQSQ